MATYVLAPSSDRRRIRHDIPISHDDSVDLAGTQSLRSVMTIYGHENRTFRANPVYHPRDRLKPDTWGL